MDIKKVYFKNGEFSLQTFIDELKSGENDNYELIKDFLIFSRDNKEFINDCFNNSELNGYDEKNLFIAGGLIAAAKYRNENECNEPVETAAKVLAEELKITNNGK